MNPTKRLRRAHYVAHKEHARTLVIQRIDHWTKEYQGHGYDFVTNVHCIAIRSQRTRWGSCSKKGNLNFNYKIVLLPLHLTDYIIVHELCHLKEFNHSQNFWDLVAVMVPDHMKCRTELREFEKKFRIEESVVLKTSESIIKKILSIIK